MGEFNLRRIVLDVVKPAVEPSLVSIADAIVGVEGVENVNLTVEDCQLALRTDIRLPAETACPAGALLRCNYGYTRACHRIAYIRK